MQLDATIVVERSVSEVFEYWADLERAPEWAAPVVERRKLTEGPVGVGTRFRAVDRFPGKDMEFDVEITAFEPDHRMAASVSPPMDGSWEARFREVTGGTELTLTADISPPGPLRVLAPVMGGWMKRAIIKDLRSFKRNLEAA